MTDVRAMTAAECQSLLEYLQAVPAEGFDQMTACDPWTVNHLVAHLTALNNQTMPNFAKGFIKARFNFDTFVNQDMQKYLDDPLRHFEQAIKSPSTPGRLSTVALGEVLCHGEDIRRALGDRGEHPAEHILEVAPMYVDTKAPLNGRGRVEGLRLRATDVDWSYGDGPEVAGPGMDLLLAMTGRAAALDACEGDGVDTMRSRC